MMIDFLKYFDFTFEIINERPKLSIKLKKEYKNKVKSEKTLNALTIDFFLYYFEDINLANELYNFRKSLCNKSHAINFFYQNNIISLEEFNFCNKWLIEVEKKFKENHLTAMKSEKVRNNLKKSCNPELSSKRLKKLWAEQYDKMLNASHNPITKNKRINSFKKWYEKNQEHFKNICRNPSRIKKIRNSSKNMWKNASTDLKFKMTNNFKKSIKYNNHFMNKFEAKIAKYLDEKNIKWEYEKYFEIENSFVKPDFIINNNIVLECFGDYWHANPEIYSSTDILYSTKTALDQWNIDEKRIEKLKKAFRHVIVIWEKESINLNETMEKKILCLI